MDFAEYVSFHPFTFKRSVSFYVMYVSGKQQMLEFSLCCFDLVYTVLVKNIFSPRTLIVIIGTFLFIFTTLFHAF